MPDAKPSLALAFNLPPERAVEYFQSRGMRIAKDWQSLAAAVRAGSFSVAGVLKAQVLEDIRAALLGAIENGTSYADFKRELIPKLQAAGWWGRWPHDTQTGEIVPGKGLKPRRLETVFRTNVQSAYMAGRYKGMVENSDQRPFWMYVAILDGRTRPRHRALHGRVFRWDDPIWRVIYPPNGYNCRCRVRALSQADMDREGLSLSSGGDYLETVQVDLGPRGGKVAVTGYRDPSTHEFFSPDPGFDHNPADGWGLDVELARRVTAIRSREIRTQTWQALNNAPARMEAYWDWANSVLDAARPGNTTQVVGFVDEDVADFMAAQGQAPIRVVGINEKRLVHADSRKHHEGGIALERDEYAELPGIIAQPDAVFYDTKNRHFAYVRYLADGGVVFLALDVDATVKRVGRIDALVNAYRLPGNQEGSGRLEDRNRFVKMGDVGQ